MFAKMMMIGAVALFCVMSVKCMPTNTDNDKAQNLPSADFAVAPPCTGPSAKEGDRICVSPNTGNYRTCYNGNWVDDVCPEAATCLEKDRRVHCRKLILNADHGRGDGHAGLVNADDVTNHGQVSVDAKTNTNTNTHVETSKNQDNKSPTDTAPGTECNEGDRICVSPNSFNYRTCYNGHYVDATCEEGATCLEEAPKRVHCRKLIRNAPQIDAQGQQH